MHLFHAKDAVKKSSGGKPTMASVSPLIPVLRSTHWWERMIGMTWFAPTWRWLAISLRARKLIASAQVTRSQLPRLSVARLSPEMTLPIVKKRIYYGIKSNNPEFTKKQIAAIRELVCPWCKKELDKIEAYGGGVACLGCGVLFIWGPPVS